MTAFLWLATALARFGGASALTTPIIHPTQTDPWNGDIWVPGPSSRVWEGIDLPEDVDAKPVPNNKQTTRHRTLANKASNLFMLLGMFDTGTNLFTQLAANNFPDVRKMKPHMWKHSNSGADAIYETVSRGLPQKTSMSELVVVVMVRSPIAQMVSLKKAPYDIEPCVRRSYAGMGTPCGAPLNDARLYSEGIERNMSCCGKHYSSTMDVYNQYMQQYNRLQRDGRFKEVMIVSYEDLLLDPGKVMQKFGAAFGVNLPAKIKISEESAKTHGDSVGRAAAIKKYTSRSWLHEVGHAGLKVLCSALDKNLIGDRFEASYRGTERVSYVQDCLEPDAKTEEHRSNKEIKGAT